MPTVQNFFASPMAFFGPSPVRNHPVLAPQQVHRHYANCALAPLQEQDLVVRRNPQQIAQICVRGLGNRHELFAAVAHLHHRHARALPVEHVLAGLE
jgi:hypothetical protein